MNDMRLDEWLSLPSDIQEVASITSVEDSSALGIARAIMVERERCARIAEDAGRDYAAYREHWQARDACREVAAAIRKGD